MPIPPIPWWQRIFELHQWALDCVDWPAHIDRLNREYRLSGKTTLSPPLDGWPPAWFTGDIERLSPNDWVLVVSLNPALAESGHYAVDNPNLSPWRFWCDHNLHRENWNRRSRFFPRLVDLASHALGENVSGADAPTFATKRMLFLEFSPYASSSFLTLDWGIIQGIADGDIGFAINRQMRSIVFNHGKPRLILVNGRVAVHDINDYQRPNWREFEVRPSQESETAMTLWRGVVRV